MIAALIKRENTQRAVRVCQSKNCKLNSPKNRNMKIKLAPLLTIAAGCWLAGLTVSATPIPENCQTGGFAVGCQAWTFKDSSVLEAIDKTAAAGGKVIEFFPGQKFT